MTPQSGLTKMRWGGLWLAVLGLGAACVGVAPPTAPTLTGTAPLPQLTTAPAPTPTSPPTPTPAAAPNLLGVHLLLDDGRHAWPMDRWPAHLRAARALVGAGGQVVQLVRLDDLSPTRWQAWLDLCAALDLRPILRLATTFDTAAGYWTAPPPDADGRYHTVAARYAAFVAALRWPAGPPTVLVGNEPNHGEEWGGVADPAAYARFLIDVAAALHAVDPAVRVVNAPLDHYAPHTNGLPFVNGFTYVDAETFMDAMRTEAPEVFTVIDAWGAHPYPLGPFVEGPWQQAFQIDLLNEAHNPAHTAPPAGLYNRGVNAYLWELHKLETYGVRDLDVLITETGWRHAESTVADAKDGGRDWPEVRTVAGYVDLALNGNGGRYPGWPETGWTPWRADPQVKAVVFFALNGLPAEWGHTNWLELDPTGEVLGVYPLAAALTAGR